MKQSRKLQTQIPKGKWHRRRLVGNTLFGASLAIAGTLSPGMVHSQNPVHHSKTVNAGLAMQWKNHGRQMQMAQRQPGFGGVRIAQAQSPFPPGTGPNEKALREIFPEQKPSTQPPRQKPRSSRPRTPANPPNEMNPGSAPANQNPQGIQPKIPQQNHPNPNAEAAPQPGVRGQGRTPKAGTPQQREPIDGVIRAFEDSRKAFEKGVSVADNLRRTWLLRLFGAGIGFAGVGTGVFLLLGKTKRGDPIVLQASKKIAALKAGKGLAPFGAAAGAVWPITTMGVTGLAFTTYLVVKLRKRAKDRGIRTSPALDALAETPEFRRIDEEAERAPRRTGRELWDDARTVLGSFDEGLRNAANNFRARLGRGRRGRGG